MNLKLNLMKMDIYIEIMDIQKQQLIMKIKITLK